MFSETRKEVWECIETNYGEGNRIHNLLLDQEEEACLHILGNQVAHVLFRLGCLPLVQHADGLLTAGAVFSAKVGVPAAVGMYRSTVRRNTVRCTLSPATGNATRDSVGLYLAAAAFLPLVVLVGLFSYEVCGGGEVWRNLNSDIIQVSFEFDKVGSANLFLSSKRVVANHGAQ